MRSRLVRLLALFGICWLPSMLLAHHSFAQFDHEHTIELAGTMRALEWESPHSWIWIDVTRSDGSTESWGGEFSGGPSSLPREGFMRNTVQPGDKIVLTLYPARDGSKAGSVAKVQLPDGQVLSFHSPPDVTPSSPTSPPNSRPSSPPK
jgi:hypothetical protein